MHLANLLDRPLFRNSWISWAETLAVTAALFAVLLLVRRLVRAYHARLLKTERVELVEVPVEALAATSTWFLGVLALFGGLFPLEMAPRTRTVVDDVVTVAVFLEVGIWCGRAVNAWLVRRQRAATANDDRASVGSYGVLGFLAKVVVWAMVILLALDNLGINVTALVAGLGVGGIAVALAVQNILGDIFASLSITFDRPFVVGEFLAVGDFMGTVSQIGIKSTRLSSLSGEQLVMSNADLLKSRVRNYGRMKERRVVFTVGVTYETPTAALEKIPGIIRKAIESQKDTRFDRSHFSAHGAASLDFETVYYVLSSDYNRYMDIQQAINLQIHREFEALHVEFAYPTQRVLLERAHTSNGASAATASAKPS